MATSDPDVGAIVIEADRLELSGCSKGCSKQGRGAGCMQQMALHVQPKSRQTSIQLSFFLFSASLRYPRGTVTICQWEKKNAPVSRSATGLQPGEGGKREGEGMVIGGT